MVFSHPPKHGFYDLVDRINLVILLCIVWNGEFISKSQISIHKFNDFILEIIFVVKYQLYGETKLSDDITHGKKRKAFPCGKCR
jgi:hypothetical protein